MARAYWKGYLKLSLVSCPIAANPASSASERVSFRQINKQTGNRLRQQLVDEVTREQVSAEDKGRGFEIDKGVFIPIDDEEIEAIEIESNHTVEIDRFVPAAQIDKRYYDSPYYIAPNDTVGQEAFAVIRDAMKGKNMVALARIVLNKRERVIALEPLGRGLLGTTLRYPYEVRRAEDYFDEIPDLKVPGEMLKLAEHILETKRGDFDPSQFEDHYETALVEMLRKKQAGFQPPKGKEPIAAPRNVINLMDALRQSIKSERSNAPKDSAGRPSAERPAAEREGAERPNAPRPKKGSKRIAGQKEMLFPIAGKKPVREEAKKAPRASGRQSKAG